MLLKKLMAWRRDWAVDLLLRLEVLNLKLLKLHGIPPFLLFQRLHLVRLLLQYLVLRLMLHNMVQELLLTLLHQLALRLLLSLLNL